MPDSIIDKSIRRKGRGAGFNPPNRFSQLHLEPIEIEWGPDDEERKIQTVFLKDTSKTILAKNDSPDIPFTYSINPYRGCEHGCIYCYARPSHEYLGFSSGIDFETKIMVKMDAARLLSEAFQKKSWKPQMVCLSGNTDCYQPVERKLKITRQCLEVFLKYRNPVGIITKNHLVTRDLDILKQLAELNLISVTISMTTLDETLTRRMEPRTSIASRRLETIEALASSGIPVEVLISPVIPGLNDKELPALLREISARGGRSASYVFLRLPGPVQQLFSEWLEREFPDRAAKILHLVKDVHGGKLDDPRFNIRFEGKGEMARAIDKLFRLNCRKYGLNKAGVSLSTDHFRHKELRQEDLFR
jgi:DNA repair photolyase